MNCLSNIKCLHSFHLSTYADLIQWDASKQSWGWRDVNGPRCLDRALDTLSLPEALAVPSLPGQTWHLKSNTILADTSRLTEILQVSTHACPTGIVLLVVYRVRSLPLAVISPPKGLLLHDPSPPQIYTGSMVTEKWFPEIFEGLHDTASLVTLISSSGRASHSSAVPAARSSLSTLPTTVEVCRVTSFLPLMWDWFP